jgi:hypothetical protein
MGDVTRLFSNDGTLDSVHHSGGWVNGDAKVEAAAMRDMSIRQRKTCKRSNAPLVTERLFASKTRSRRSRIGKAEEAGLVEAALAKARSKPFAKCND